MTDTKLDADLAAYEERHEKLERFFAAVMAMCERDERLGMNFVMSSELREAAKELL